MNENINKSNSEITNDQIFAVAVTTEQGCEEFLKLELEQRFKIISEVRENWVKFNSTLKQLVEVMYSSQLAKRVVLELDEGKFTDIDDFQTKTKMKIDSSELLFKMLKSRSFRVMCDRSGSHEFNSVEVDFRITESIRELMKNKKEEAQINLSAPDVIVYVRIMGDKYLLGIDCAGRELSKRQHLVFQNPNAIKGTVAFAALLFAGYKPGQLMLDPFSLSGNVVLEAAIFESGTALNYYTKKFTLMELPEFRSIVDETMKKVDSKIKGPPSKPNIISSDALFNNVSAQKKNAKIAGVEKFIAYSRTDIQDLDIKTFDDRLDVVCTRIIESSSHFPESKARVIYEKMFKNLKYIVKKNAPIVFILRNPELLEAVAKEEGYEELGIKQVWQGQQPFFIVKFKTSELSDYGHD